MTTYIHNSDIGTIFRLTITDTSGTAIDVSTATIKYFYFQKPDRSKIKRTAEFYDDGTDGIIQYTSVAGDIDQDGSWNIQGYVETSSGNFYTQMASFQVLTTLYTA